MSNREEQFNSFANLDFSELAKIIFKSGHQPRNATDYYYHSKTKIIYSYYWGSDAGKWGIYLGSFDSPSIKSPSELCTILPENKVNTKTNNKQKLENEINIMKNNKKKLEDEINTMESSKHKLEDEINTLENNKQQLENKVTTKTHNKQKSRNKVNTKTHRKQKVENESNNACECIIL